MEPTTNIQRNYHPKIETWLLRGNGKGAIVQFDSAQHSDEYGKLQDKYGKQFGMKGRFAFADMFNLSKAERVEGVPFEWGLSGPDGAWFNLVKLPDTTEDQIKRAKHRLRTDRDVVSISVLRIKELIDNTF